MVKVVDTKMNETHTDYSLYPRDDYKYMLEST